MATSISTPDVTQVDSLVVTTEIVGDTQKPAQNPYGKATTTINHDATATAQASKWIVSIGIDTSLIEDDAADGAGVLSAIDDIIAHFTAVKTQLTALVPTL